MELLKRRKYIKLLNAIGAEKLEKKYITVYYNDLQFHEISKLPEEMKKSLLYIEYWRFEFLKFSARNDGTVCNKKKKVYKYLNGLKNKILKNSKKNGEIVMEIMVLKEKYRMWNDSWLWRLNEMKIPFWKRLIGRICRILSLKKLMK
jgi:hypothetical protein